MKIILRADVENLGRLGDVVTVKAGYGRNYLLPQGLAMLVTPGNLKAFELERKKLQARMDALRAAVQDNVPVAIYSLEMSMDQLMMRMLCAWGKVDLGHLRRGYLDSEEWSRLYHAADVLGQAPIYIDDTPALSPLELRARTRRLKAESGVGLVMVDYLQLMRGSKRTDSREQEISEISRSLKGLAKEMDIPVVALSQLNRKLEERTDKRPLLSDLRESGAIEQDADVIMFIYRDEVYHKQPDNPHKGSAEIIIGKQRNGPIGTATLAYLGSYTAFEDLEPGLSPQPSEAGGE